MCAASLIREQIQDLPSAVPEVRIHSAPPTSLACQRFSGATRETRARAGSFVCRPAPEITRLGKIRFPSVMCSELRSIRCKRDSTFQQAVRHFLGIPVSARLPKRGVPEVDNAEI